MKFYEILMPPKTYTLYLFVGYATYTKSKGGVRGAGGGSRLYGPPPGLRFFTENYDSCTSYMNLMQKKFSNRHFMNKIGIFQNLKCITTEGI